MPTLLEHACPRCGLRHDGGTSACAACGAPTRVAATRPVFEERLAVRATALVRERATLLEPWLFLALGLALAPLFAWVPFLQYMAGFLASLVHQMGHAGLGWLFGMPVAPAFTAGEHTALHGQPWLPLTLGIFAMLVATAWAFLAGRRRALALTLIVVGYPALALTEARDLVHLLAGHAAELTAATLCLWVTLLGRRTESPVERALHGAAGWLLLGNNAAACWQLVRAPVHLQKGSSSSPALATDCLRTSELLGWSPTAVSMAMLCGGVLVVPAAVWLWRVTRAPR